MPQASFDIVSKIDLQEVLNAVQQTLKEVQQRYDLKGTGSTVELDQANNKIVVHSPDEFTLKQVLDILGQKLVRRGVPLKGLDYQKIQPAAGSAVVQEINLQQGIPIEKAREIVKLIKQTKLKVQAAIQGDQVRVTGKNRDDLQQVIAAMKEQDLGIDMQFTNYRG
jgi:cyclic-di-GMP-binding protein